MGLGVRIPWITSRDMERLVPIVLFFVMLAGHTRAQNDSLEHYDTEEAENINSYDLITDDPNWVPYRGGFDFREGIYRTWKEFRMNAPSMPANELVNSEGQRITNITDHDGRIFHDDGTGERTRVALDGVWGYCGNDAVYMRTRNGFQRIVMIGSLCHMLVEEWQVGAGLMAPGAPVLIQRLLDMSNGSFDVLNASSLARSIQHDTVLYKEFMDLPPRKRNADEALIRFMRKYNERNTLLFPPS